MTDAKSYFISPFRLSFSFFRVVRYDSNLHVHINLHAYVFVSRLLCAGWFKICQLTLNSQGSMSDSMTTEVFCRTTSGEIQCKNWASQCPKPDVNSVRVTNRQYPVHTTAQRRRYFLAPIWVYHHVQKFQAEHICWTVPWRNLILLTIWFYWRTLSSYNRAIYLTVSIR